MKPIHFKGSNVTFAADQPEYLPLPACKLGNPEGEVVSCWQLTWQERLRVLVTGKFYLSLWTFNQPLQPQRPSVTNPLAPLYEKTRRPHWLRSLGGLRRKLQAN